MTNANYVTLAALVVLEVVISGCAALSGKLNVPPEYKQKVILEVSDSQQMFQAPRSGYDPGDLQSFQSQHTFPLDVEDAFKEIFGQVEVVKPDAKIDMQAPDVPAVFEVKMLDLANDIYMEATSYRAQVVIAIAMKSPQGNIFWQKSFRGEGYITADPQFSSGLGPQDAVLDAVRDALGQMKKAIVDSPQVRHQMKYYQAIEKARKEKEIKV
jgi:hypothetical protein